MERKLRTCAVCRISYKFCNKCREDAGKPLWFFTFCSSNCHDIYDITSKFENNQFDANIAKSELDKLDLSKLNNFGESYKKSIDKIMNSVSATTNTNDIVDIVVLDENTEVKNDAEIIAEEKFESTEGIVEEEKVLKKPRSRKAKNDVEE